MITAFSKEKLAFQVVSSLFCVISKNVVVTNLKTHVEMLGE